MTFVNGSGTTARLLPCKLVNRRSHFRLSANKPHAEPMQIFVKMIDGKTETFDLEAHDLVDVVMAKIKDSNGMPPEYQRLIFGGRQLECGSTLAEVGVQRESTLHLCVRAGHTQAAPVIRVQIQRGNGDHAPVTVSIPPMSYGFSASTTAAGLVAYAARALGCEYTDVKRLTLCSTTLGSNEDLALLQADGSSVVTAWLKEGAGGLTRSRTREERDAEGFAHAIDLETPQKWHRAAEADVATRVAKARSTYSTEVDTRFRALMQPHCDAFVADEIDGAELQRRKASMREKAVAEHGPLSTLDQAFVDYTEAEKVRAAAEVAADAAHAKLEAALAPLEKVHERPATPPSPSF